MPSPHPIELRLAAVAAIERGEGTLEEVAEQFGIGKRTLSTWLARQRDGVPLEPSARGGGNFSTVDIKRLLALVAATRDATTDELTRAYNAKLAKKGRVHRSSILRALKREGFVFKKNVRGPQSKTAPKSG